MLLFTSVLLFRLTFYSFQPDRYSLSTALVVLGCIWLLGGFLVVFLVEIVQENENENENESENENENEKDKTVNDINKGVFNKTGDDIRNDAISNTENPVAVGVKEKGEANEPANRHLCRVKYPLNDTESNAVVVDQAPVQADADSATVKTGFNGAAVQTDADSAAVKTGFNGAAVQNDTYSAAVKTDADSAAVKTDTATVKTDATDGSRFQNPFTAPVFKTPACLCMMAYGFFHFGGMIGTVIFLPPLLNESLLPKFGAGPSIATTVGQAAALAAGQAAALAAGQADVTTALAVFGGGGILGDILCGLVMNFGPLADNHFGLFVANNVVMLVVVGQYMKISFCLLLFLLLLLLL